MGDQDPNSAASAVLEALGFALFIRDESGALRLHGTPPDWLRAIWPGLDKQLPIDQASPFLENFLVDADACWKTGGETRARSGPWVERTADGSDLTLEATALNAGNQALLLLERLGEIFEAKKSMLQKARETAIAYQRLNSEMQKKEILLSCISEEMNAALANVITSLRLIEMEKNPARIAQLVGLASRATDEQQALINRVLNVFAAELEGLYGLNGATPAEAKLGDVLRSVAETVAPPFAEKRVRLSLPEKVGSEVRVAMDAGHLVRVLSNLLEQGLENAPAAGEVKLNLVEEADSLLLQVFDNGTPWPRNEDFFSRGAAAATRPHPSQVPLQFCRIAVENCRGEIGYEPGAEGGNCFWIRLPKPPPAHK